MVGGWIVSLQERPDRIRVIVAQNRHGRHQFMGVDVARTGRPLRLGDALWWQSGSCYWTPADRGVEDVAIPKIGYSYGTGLTP